MDLETILAYEFLNNTLQTWLYALGMFFVFLVLRFKIIKWFIDILKIFTSKTKNTVDDKIVKVMEAPLRWVVVIVGLQLSISFFEMSTELSLIYERIIRSFFILITSWLFFNLLSIFSDIFHSIAIKVNSELGESLGKLLLTIFRAVIIVISVMAVFQEWGFNVSAFLASMGLVGMAFALAAKDTAANLFGSMVIFTDRPFKIGDWIKTPQVEGTIEDIGMRSTKVRTFAQALVSVPNGVLANEAILNWSQMQKRRIKMTIGLTYDTNSTQMQAILSEIRSMLEEDEDIHQQTIFIHFTDFQDSALGIFCYFFTKTTNWGEYMQVREKINLNIMKIVEDNRAAFAFPSQSLYVESMPKDAYVS